MPQASPLSPEFLQTVSTGPGVYQMLGNKEVLYVGKAVNLRKRLASYQRHQAEEHSKTAVMLARVRRIETILTTTEKEALILEASLIKKHRPRYNVILRDDKNYPLIKVTVRDRWPGITVTRKRLRDGSRYFGPYSSASAMRDTLKLLQTLFPLHRCRQVKARSRPCLNFQIGQCLAPCARPVNPEMYNELVNGVLLLLEGRNRELLAGLNRQMQAAAKALLFEKAALLRDQIRGLELTLERQMVAADHYRDEDVFGLVRRDASVAVAIMFIRAGRISGVQTFFLSDPLGADAAILTQTIIQYYSAQRQPPSRILLPVIPADCGLLEERLSEIREAAVSILVPQRGARMQLMKMAGENAGQVFSEKTRQEKSWQNLAAGLQNNLHLPHRPDHIECVDISNIGGQQAVGSLVCFKQGQKHTAGFRHYRIKSKNEPDDYAMMREVLDRRIKRGVVDGDLPDLLLLDGGKGQLNLARNVLEAHDLADTIELVAIAKEKQQEGEKLFRPNRKNPIILAGHSPTLLFLMRIRDEAHRFGITRHRKLRDKKTTCSELDNLRGVGKKRKQILLKSFGSFSRLLQANPEELGAVPGIGPALADSIYRQLHN